MKKTLLLTVAAIAAIAFTSCSDDKNNDAPQGTYYEIDATQAGTWHYFSFAGGAVIGSAADTESDPKGNSEWFGRSDWDIAVNRYHVRTNSGTHTSNNGGVYAFDASAKFEKVYGIPSGAVFTPDEVVTISSMGGINPDNGQTIIISTDVIQSPLAQVVEVSASMPPTYTKKPVYIFRSADGSKFYKVEFTRYKKGNDSGMVQFRVSGVN